MEHTIDKKALKEVAKTKPKPSLHKTAQTVSDRVQSEKEAEKAIKTKQGLNSQSKGKSSPSIGKTVESKGKSSPSIGKTAESKGKSKTSSKKAVQSKGKSKTSSKKKGSGDVQKVVIITGASSGIGLRIAKQMKKEGFKVLNVSRTESCEAISNYTADACTDGQMAKSLKQAVRDEGRVDILIYCAGQTLAGAVEEVGLTHARNLFNVNYFGAIEAAQEVIPTMRKQNSGKIIFIGSLAGRVPLPYEAYYSGSKAALSMLAKSLSIELDKFDIKVSCLSPGGTATPLTKKRQIIKQKNSPYETEISLAVKKVTEAETEGASAVDVASQIVSHATSENPPVDTVLGFKNKVTDFMFKVLPPNMTTRIVQASFME
jgi:short-subunit dehydrogenase